MRNTTKSKFRELYKNNPKFIEIYQTYLNSNHFNRLVQNGGNKQQKAYIINLDIKPDRWEKIQKDFKNSSINLERFPAITKLKQPIGGKIKGGSKELKEKIPRIIHQIWVGQNPLPKKSKEFIKKIKELHPTFEYRLWGNTDITPHNFVNIDYINKTDSYAQKADIMRYEILYNYGGIYLDIDMEVLKNLEPLLTHNLVVCNEDNNTDKYMSNGFIASSKYNYNIKKAVDNIKNIDFSLPINEASGPYYLRKNIVLDSNTRLLPTIYIYPIPYGRKINKEYLNTLDISQSYTIHHWDKAW
jgi:mannosyltransferase OCH1-like enzyme